MNDNDTRAVIAFLAYCTLVVGIMSVAKYKIAKLDWANTIKVAEMAKEAAAR